ncbi:glycosyltransferase family 2 protein [Arthrobacter psychrolactophilus]|uniref:glycosyltransferase family 2 protein n=1 Tax=Arthrobacter psychrolactophilus TaxID=92442 RepID=UPI0011B3CC5F|nr:glycosyltransferase family 2 protein [Arthrobacter psychrolactophilus]
MTLNNILRQVRRVPNRSKRLVQMLWLTSKYQIVNRFHKKSLRGDLELVVSLTSYGQRTNSVFLTIESIFAGRKQPKRIILWIDEIEVFENLPSSLRRLQNRGLEIIHCLNYGPHKKYFPYILSTDDDSAAPLVTADDDIFYPTNWLDSLYKEYLSSKNCIVSHRARQISLTGSELPIIEKYSNWKLSGSIEPSFATFSTGTGGVIYPPTVQRALRNRGEDFTDNYWHADDIWLHSTAVMAGVRTRQVTSSPKNFLMLLGSQANALFKRNHEGDGNDLMIQSAYSRDLVESIAGDVEAINKV